MKRIVIIALLAFGASDAGAIEHLDAGTLKCVDLRARVSLNKAVVLHYSRPSDNLYQKVVGDGAGCALERAEQFSFPTADTAGCRLTVCRPSYPFRGGR